MQKTLANFDYSTGIDYQLIILLYLFRQRAGQVRHVPEENLCCTSVLNDTRAEGEA